MTERPGSLTRRYRYVMRCQACGRTHVRYYGAPMKEKGSVMTIAEACPALYCRAQNGQYEIMHVRKVKG